MVYNGRDEFGNMQDLLTQMDPQEDPNTHVEFKERTRVLCARFLGGAWKTVSLKNFKICRIKGGMSNMLFLCRLTENHPPIRNEPDKVLLRVYFNPETENHLVAESVIFTLLSERHLGPKLYGIFSGGRLEEYIPSRPLTCEEIALTQMSNKIARRLARVHQLEVPIWKEPDYLCDALERWLGQLQRMPSGRREFDLPAQYEEFGVSRRVTIDELLVEARALRERLAKSDSPVVFCHNDLQEGNILLPKASSGNIRLPSASDESPEGLHNADSLSAFSPNDPKLVLIDFEYASYNYRAFDFANHFVEYSIKYDVDEAPYYEMLPRNFPTEAHMHDFMVNYLKGAGAKMDAETLNRTADEMVLETLAFVPVSHFLWGVWGLLQVEVSPVTFGFAEYGRERLCLYFKNKHLFAHLDK